MSRTAILMLNIPAYRILPAILNADISLPSGGMYKIYPIPTGLSEDDTINDYLGYIRIVNSLSEIENSCIGKTNGTLT